MRWCRYGSPWKEAEAEKNLLRTHTTAVSSRMLYKLAQDGFKPAKYFSIDRVFRNEAIDRTHLAEFHQIEGGTAPTLLTSKSRIPTLILPQSRLPSSSERPSDHLSCPIELKGSYPCTPSHSYCVGGKLKMHQLASQFYDGYSYDNGHRLHHLS